MKSRFPLFSSGLLALIVLAALLVPWLSPFDYFTPDWDGTDLSPSQ